MKRPFVFAVLLCGAVLELMAGSITYSYTYIVRSTHYRIMMAPPNSTNQAKYLTDSTGEVLSFSSMSDAAVACADLTETGDGTLEFTPDASSSDSVHTVTRTVYYQGDSPSELMQKANALQVQFGREMALIVPQDPVVHEQESMKILGEKISASKFAIDTTLSLDRKLSRNNSDRSPDPVRYASGETIHSITDLSMPNGEHPIEWTRTWLSSRQMTTLMGKDWFSTLDQRVIRGTLHQGRTILADWESRLRELENRHEEEMTFLYGKDQRGGFISWLFEVNNRVRALRESDTAARLALEKERSEGAPAEHNAEINVQIGSLGINWSLTAPFTNQVEAWAREYLSQGWMNELAPAKMKALVALRSQIEKLRDRDLPQLRLQIAVSDAALAVNTFWNDGLAPVSSGSGWDTLLILDPEGMERVYRIPQMPQENPSDVLGITDIPNFFPQGAVLEGLSFLAGEKVVLMPDGSVTRTLQSGEEWKFNPYGQLVSWKSRDQDGWMVQYDGDGGLPLRMVDKDSPRSFDLEFGGPQGKELQKIQGPGARTRTFTYDQQGLLTGVTDSLENTSHYVYEGSLLIKMINPDGTSRSTSYVESAPGSGEFLTRSNSNESGWSEYFSYGETAGKTLHSSFSGKVIEHAHDSKSRPLGQRDGTGLGTSLRYDSEGRMIQSMNRSGDKTDHVWSADSTNKTIIHPDGSKTLEWYNSEGRLSELRFPNGTSVSYEYHPNGLEKRRTFGDGSYEDRTWSSNGRLLSLTSSLGRTWLHTYDSNGFLASVQDPGGKISLFTHDAWGSLTSETLATGLHLTCEYDSEGRLLRRNWPDGSSEQFSWDWRNNLTSRIARDGSLSSWTYDVLGQLASATEPSGTLVNYRYDPDGRMLEEKRSGQDKQVLESWQYQYDDTGNLEVREYRGRTDAPLAERFEHDAEGRVVSALSPGLVLSSYTYDAMGQLLRKEVGRSGRYVETFAYRGGALEAWSAKDGPSWEVLRRDARGRILSLRKDGLYTSTYSYDDHRPGKITRTSNSDTTEHYDYRGLLTYRKAIDGLEEWFSHDPLGTLTSYRNSRGLTLAYELDVESRVRRLFKNGELFESYRYDQGGRIVEIQDWRGGISRWTYNGAGLPVKKIDRDGAAHSWVWNGLGLLLAETDPSGCTRTYHYDPWWRLVGMEDAAGMLVQRELDADGRVLSQTERPGRALRYRYDDAGHPVWSQGSDGPELAWDLDGQGRPIQEYVNGNQAWKRNYDPSGLVREEIVQGSEARTWTYHENGKPRTVGGPSIALISYEMDTAGRLSKVEGLDDTRTSLDFSWESGNLLSSARSSRSRIDFVHDQEGRMLEAREQRTGLVQKQAWYPDGTLAQRSLDGRVSNYEYTGEGRIRMSRFSQGETVHSGYDRAGRETRRTLPGGMTQEISWDKAGRYLGYALLKEKKIVGGEALVYDALGRIAATVDFRGEWKEYRYDKGGRIVSVLYPATKALLEADKEEILASGMTPEAHSNAQFIIPDHELAMAMDASFRSVFKGSPARAISGQTTVRHGFSHDALGRLGTKTNAWGTLAHIWDDAHRLIRKGNRVFVYDADGRLKEENCGDETLVYRWNGADMLISMVWSQAGIPGASLFFDYDALGRPILRQEVLDDGSVTSTRYQALAASRQILEEVEIVVIGTAQLSGKSTNLTPGRYFNPAAPARTAGSSSGTPGEVKHYLFHGEEVIGYRQGTTNTWFIKDQQGTIRHEILVDQDGTSTINSLHYDIFGKRMQEGSRGGASLGYLGKFQDDTSALVHLDHRPYQTMTATFGTKDPARHGSAVGWYGYCDFDPVNYMDPSGLRPERNPVLGAVGRNMGPPRVFQNQLRPEMPSGPCFYRTLQAAAEEAAGRNMTLDEIKAATKALLAANAIGKEPNSPKPEPTYYVFNPSAVTKDALTRLGYPDAKATVSEYMKVPTGNADYTARNIAGHFQLGDSWGNLTWDPFKFANPESQKKYLGRAKRVREITIDLTP